MPGDILETIDGALADCTSADAMRWRPAAASEEHAGTAASMMELCSSAYAGLDGWGRYDRRTRWVMDLASYRQLRAECEAVTGRQADPDTRTPDPGDMLFGVFIEVRDDGGQPHLENTARAAGV